MFSRVTKGHEDAGPASGLPAGDWSPYGRLGDATRAYFLHPDVALAAIGGVLGRRRIRGFTLERVVDLTESGASVWQEAAVCDGRRLILWHSEEVADPGAPGGTVLDSSVQVLPLSEVRHVGMRTLVGRDGAGSRTRRGVYVVVTTGTVQEMAALPPEEGGPGAARFRPEAFRFSKSLDDGGPGQIDRLLAFGELLGRLVPSGH
ncbi:hypothetical protein [Streptacidiphilus sp. EB129]|jgi:hypothetical protein|uniref:hypothetical protein n=1 Tax=Streptacidiphilus sp. EB129 TaxID=3156262 RepID=UPI003511A311